MIWKRREKPAFATETLGSDEYYQVQSEDVDQLDAENVTFEGVLTEKPVISFYAAGWPWSISARLIEEDHSHRSLLTVDRITVSFKGPIFLRKGERVKVWGKTQNGIVHAKRVESNGTIFQT